MAWNILDKELMVLFFHVSGNALVDEQPIDSFYAWHRIHNRRHIAILTSSLQSRYLIVIHLFPLHLIDWVGQFVDHVHSAGCCLKLIDLRVNFIENNIKCNTFKCLLIGLVVSVWMCAAILNTSLFCVSALPVYIMKKGKVVEIWSRVV